MFIPKFDKVWQMMKSIDATTGVFLLWDSTKKKTIKEIIFKLTMPRLLFFFTFLMISTLIVTNFKLISIFLCSSVTFSIIALYGTVLCYVTKRDVVKDLLKWCESLYDVRKKYHESVQTIAESKLAVIERHSTTCLKWLRIILYVDGIGYTLGFSIIGIFLPENIYSKFSPPLPFFLPFKNQKTWLSFGCTTLIETLIAVDTGTVTIYMFSLIICVFMHILGFMDIIQQVVKKMKQEILTNINKDEFKPELTGGSSLNLETLAIVNASLMKSQNNKISFDERIKVLNDMISEVNSVIDAAGELYAIPFFLTELAGLGSLFVSGLLFTVVNEQHLFAIGINIVCSLLFIICFINEKIMEKFEKINEALYDIPWYDLNVNQRKSLIMLMHCDKIQGGLTAAKIHNLTFERFGIIIKAGYTNMLVLKDLVQK